MAENYASANRTVLTKGTDAKKPPPCFRLEPKLSRHILPPFTPPLIKTKRSPPTTSLFSICKCGKGGSGEGVPL